MLYQRICCFPSGCGRKRSDPSVSSSDGEGAGDDEGGDLLDRQLAALEKLMMMGGGTAGDFSSLTGRYSRKNCAGEKLNNRPFFLRTHGMQGLRDRQFGFFPGYL